MMYKPSPESWMDYLYGEMKAGELEHMKKYLADHPEEEANWKALQLTRQHMQSVPLPPTPEAPRLLLPQKKKRSWFQSPWLHAVAAGIALMLSAKLIGVQISWQKQTISIQFGTPVVQEENKELEEKIAALHLQNQELMLQFKHDSLFQAVSKLGSSLERLENQNKALAKKDQYHALDQQQLEQLKADIGAANYQMVVDMLSKTQEYQQAYTQTLLTDFSQFLEQQRQQDLKLMEVAFNHIIQQNDLQQEETQYLLTELMTQLSD